MYSSLPVKIVMQQIEIEGSAVCEASIGRKIPSKKR
jgi:hypothetical protein